ncbi:MAG: 4-hydroxyphenylpyruvate dioxygenase [Rhodothermales bacterium]
MNPSTDEMPVLERPLEERFDDHLGLLDVDYLELWVNNARQAAHFYMTVFGFSLAAYRGLETGTRDRASYLLRQGNIRLILTAPMAGDSAIAEFCRKHGDGVRDIALTVENVDRAFRESVARGGVPVAEPADSSDENGTVRTAAVATYGDAIHTFVQRDKYRGDFLPGFRPASSPVEVHPTGIQFVDHCVGNVELGKMNDWVAFYRDVLGFTQYIHFDDKDISTEYSALMSKVMAGGRGRIKFPINEPADGKRKSQIEEYLEYNEGPGVQHIALLTADIIDTVQRLRKNGMDFLQVPTTYYEMLEDRVGKIEEPLELLQELGILVDRDDEGYLLQIFTKPVGDRPTLFFEIIQRKGARGFGKGNFKALFEAIEREQDLRGNL